MLDDALQTIERTGERWFAVELNRLKGQLMLRQGQSEATEASYCKALDIAQEQEAKLCELRAVMSMPGCGAVKGNGMRPENFSLRLTAGSARALTRWT